MHCSKQHLVVRLARLILAAGLLFTLVNTGRAEPPVPGGPQLVKDINTVNKSSMPVNYSVIGSAFYFAADDGLHGRELWRSQGTSATTQMLFDLEPGRESSNPTNITRLDDTHLVFTTMDQNWSQHLWITGADGSGLLELIQLGENQISGTLINLNGLVFFSTIDSVGNNSLWCTDGTRAGTVRALDQSIASSEIAVYNGWLYFVMSGADGEELYRLQSDGGPLQVTDLCKAAEDCGWGLGNSNPGAFTPVADRLYFIAADAERSAAVWYTTGTMDSLALAADILPGNTQPNEFYAMQAAGSGLFMLVTGEAGDHSLWYTSGTATSAHLIPSSASGISIYTSINFITLGSTFFFSAYTSPESNEMTLFRATENSVEKIDAVPGNTVSLIRAGSEVYIFSEGPSDADALWKITETGAPQRIAPVVVNWMHNAELVEFNNHLYFSSDDHLHGQELWMSDGSEPGTRMLMDLNQQVEPYGSFPDAAVIYQDNIFFPATSGNDYQALWRSDGTESGTRKVFSFNGGWPGLQDSAVSHGLLYFSAVDSQGSYGGLWRTDGTQEGTQRLMDIYARRFLNASDTLYFIADDPTHTTVGLWALTKEDTQPRMVIETGNGGDIQLGAVGSDCLLMKSTETGGWELWRTNGTVAGSRRIYQPPSTVPGYSGYPFHQLDEMVSFDGRLYFIAPALNDSSAAALYATDGASVTQITAAQGMPLFPTQPVAAGNNVYFGGLNGDTVVLWKLARGANQAEVVHTTERYMGETFQIAQLPQPYADLNGKLLFRREPPGRADWLWISDGTVRGTAPICESCDYTVNPYTEGRPVVANGHVYFPAGDDAHRMELWVSDGTDANTHLLADILPGPESSDPANLILLKNHLLFSATDSPEAGGGHGRELWRYDLPPVLYLPMIQR